MSAAARPASLFDLMDDPAPAVPAPAPEPRRAAPGRADARIDAAIYDALHRAEGAGRRWAMRRASGQSGRDLRAAIAYEFFGTTLPPLRRPGERYRIGGCNPCPCLTVDPEEEGRPAEEVDLPRLAARARELLAIPSRPGADPVDVWAVRARSSELALYAIDAPEGEEGRAEAARLMEPCHHAGKGVPEALFDRVKAAGLPAHVEIRRRPAGAGVNP